MKIERIYTLIAGRIRAQRERLGISQQEFARRIGQSRTSVTNIEAGRQRITVHALFDIAAALEVSVASMLPTPKECSHVPVVFDGQRLELSPDDAAKFRKLLGKRAAQ